MKSPRDGAFPHTWEQAIEVLRNDPAHQELVCDSYLTADLEDNCRRFALGQEFAEVLRLIERRRPNARDVLDIPAGNGIATAALAGVGYSVTAVEPDASSSVGRGAIVRVLEAMGLAARLFDAYGEALPFEAETFDVVYVRQGLHHARDLKAMLREYARVLRKGGLLLACREHVVDNYGRSLKRFLDSQVDHQLYGGENAFTLADYRAALTGAGFEAVEELGPYESPINLHPNTPDRLRAKILATIPARILATLLPSEMVYRIGLWRLRRARLPGRLYTFAALRP